MVLNITYADRVDGFYVAAHGAKDHGAVTWVIEDGKRIAAVVPPGYVEVVELAVQTGHVPLISK